MGEGIRIPSVTEEKLGDPKIPVKVYNLLKEGGAYSIDEISEKLGITRDDAGGAVLLLRSGYGFRIETKTDYAYNEEGIAIGIPKYYLAEEDRKE